MEFQRFRRVNCCKLNFCLRTKFDPNRCYTIPNAVNTQQFYPDFEISKFKNLTDKIYVVFVARLEYRKGVDLLIGLIPIITKKF